MGKTYHNVSVQFYSKEGKLPDGLTELVENYKAEITSKIPIKVNGVLEQYSVVVDFGKSSELDISNFMDDCSKLNPEKVSEQKIVAVTSGDYTPSLARRVKEFFKR